MYPRAVTLSIAVAALSLLAIPIGTGTPAASSAFASSSAAPGATFATPTNVTYTSSVDGFHLSYAEWLPLGYKATNVDDLVVYLHGLEPGSNRSVSGGVASDLAHLASGSGPDASAARGLLANASHAKFIVIAVNTRTAGGFYVNSPCGGPQEQDVLDAIAHEKLVRKVAAVYLAGFSMGSIGALSLADHHPKLFAGVAVMATGTDLFEMRAWAIHEAAAGASWAPGAVTAWANNVCSVKNGGPAYEAYLTAPRFHPQNLSGIKIWISAGGQDLLIPDNASLWPYMQVNNTFVNSTCVVASALAEPSNCTTTFSSLHKSNANYEFRFVYEADAPHTFAQIDPSDVFDYWAGTTSGGLYVAGFPPVTVTAAP